jgi:hypothetical protein
VTATRSTAPLGRSTQILRLTSRRADTNGTLLRLIEASAVWPILTGVRQLVRRPRSRQRGNRQPSARPFGVGSVTRGESGGGVLLFVRRSLLSASNQINERSKVDTRYLNDVITFLP